MESQLEVMCCTTRSHLKLVERFGTVKQQTSVRLDADVLAWLKAQGKGYQTRMNKILREAMLKDLKNH